ncbi:MAG: hypothetical protein ACRDPB_06340 [Nocardioidaceae bacterium]
MQDVTERRSLERVLREEVGRFRRRESRRKFDPIFQVGQIGGARDSFVVRRGDLPALDTALRTEVAYSLLTQSGPQANAAWLTRPGVPEPCDADWDWFSATRAAFEIDARELAGFYAITRTGWLDLRTGRSRVWTRLRL